MIVLYAMFLDFPAQLCRPILFFFTTQVATHGIDISFKVFSN